MHILLPDIQMLEDLAVTTLKTVPRFIKLGYSLFVFLEYNCHCHTSEKNIDGKKFISYHYLRKKGGG